MPLSPEVREVVRQAAFEAFTRHLTPEEVFDEVVRICREASTPEEVQAAGYMVGRITKFGKMVVEAAAAGEPVPTPAAGIGASGSGSGVGTPAVDEEPPQAEAQVA